MYGDGGLGGGELGDGDDPELLGEGGLGGGGLGGEEGLELGDGLEGEEGLGLEAGLLVEVEVVGARAGEKVLLTARVWTLPGLFPAGPAKATTCKQKEKTH